MLSRTELHGAEAQHVCQSIAETVLVCCTNQALMALDCCATDLVLHHFGWSLQVVASASTWTL